MTVDINRMLEDAQQWQERTRTRNRVTPGTWYQIVNADTDTATVRIYDEISFWGVDADTFSNDINSITAPTIIVAINSPGGSVFEGIAIYNILRVHPARIVTRVDGLAASAASFIAQAGDERVMVSGSQMMIHDAWCVSVGNADDHRAAAEFCEKQSANIAQIYAERSALFDADHYAGLMASETWMSAGEAVDAGLADRVLTPDRKNENKIAESPPSAPTVVGAEPVDPHKGVRAAYLRKLQLSKVKQPS